MKYYLSVIWRGAGISCPDWIDVPICSFAVLTCACRCWCALLTVVTLQTPSRYCWAYMGSGVTVAWQLGFMSMPPAPDLIQPISLCLIPDTGSTWYLKGCCMVADEEPLFTPEGLNEDALGWGASRPGKSPHCRLGVPSRASPRAEWRARRRSWCRGVPHTSQQLSAPWPLGGHSRVWSLSRRRPEKLGSCKK